MNAWPQSLGMHEGWKTNPMRTNIGKTDHWTVGPPALVEQMLADAQPIYMNAGEECRSPILHKGILALDDGNFLGWLQSYSDYIDSSIFKIAFNKIVPPDNPAARVEVPGFVSRMNDTLPMNKKRTNAIACGRWPHVVSEVAPAAVAADATVSRARASDITRSAEMASRRPQVVPPPPPSQRRRMF